jgi:hypothetical protein
MKVARHEMPGRGRPEVRPVGYGMIGCRVDGLLIDGWAKRSRLKPTAEKALRERIRYLSAREFHRADHATPQHRQNIGNLSA